MTEFSTRGMTAAQFRKASAEAAQRAKFVAAFTGCVVILATLPIQGWVTMLVMGAIHGAYPAVAAIGYGTSVLFVLGANLLVGFTRRLFRK
ncbi:hypothetical protein [Streptomyces fulvorobeus]|uniref:Uncharacterized protein n=1 Tax=Streptomyces fulvorobeus TaxID=284028 RepID=A0A7J0CDY6_9ACTN|nr:hypothetical protein [Streptomyces fulvorobeus]NYE44217.1 hypothetical protein [Streptomyces fulvorobeus]GFN00732.1 hypothetical protein Sfulv_55420 [Streptomyces fulvorobeus]